MLTALDALPVPAARHTVVHYGERNEPIVSALSARGAVVRELIVYEWQVPLDVAPLVAAIDSIIKGDVPILALTSQIQLRHLLFVAGPLRRAAARGPQQRGFVGAVGPTCAAACHEAGMRMSWFLSNQSWRRCSFDRHGQSQSRESRNDQS